MASLPVVSAGKEEAKRISLYFRGR